MPVAVVTGGSRGIGAAIAERLAGDGWEVMAVSRTGRKRTRGIRPKTIDVADLDAVADFGAKLADEGVRVDGLVNNAGLQGGMPISEQTKENWRRFMDVNVTGACFFTKAVLPLMPEGSSIVNVGSVASVRGFANRTAYCASKHALLGLTRALAVELAPRRIRVNHLVLGSFETPGLEALAAAEGADAAFYAGRQLCERLGKPEEAAAACAYLMSADAEFITGTSLTLDGGLLLNAAPEGSRAKDPQHTNWRT